MKYFDNIIPKDICNNIIIHTKVSPTSTLKEWHKNKLYNPSWIMQNKATSQVVYFLTSLISKEQNLILYPEWVQVVEWPTNSFQPPHTDTSRNSTKYTSITYLNDNYVGGKTILTNVSLESKNKIGDTLMFDGVKYEHEVTKITEGTRYVLAIWYSDDINDFILNW